MVGEEPPMTWFQSPLIWSRKESYSISWELQMPREVPVATGVLALLALLALVYHCLNEAWKSRWRLCCGSWRCPPTGKSLQFVFIHSPNEGQPGLLPSEPSPVFPEGPNGTSGLLFSFRYEEEPTLRAQSRL